MEALATGLNDIRPLFEQVVRGSHFLPSYAKEDLCESFGFVVETLADTWEHQKHYARKTPAPAKSKEPVTPTQPN